MEGLRANQTVSELNLSGCKLSDDGAKVLASIIKAGFRLSSAVDSYCKFLPVNDTDTSLSFTIVYCW